MDQVLNWFTPDITPYWIVVVAAVMTVIIVVPVYVVDYLENKRKKKVEEEPQSETEVVPKLSKAKIKAQLKTLDKAPRGKVTWL